MGIRDDYLMKQFLTLARVIAKIWRQENGLDYQTDTDELEDAIGEAVSMDPELFFSLEPESMVMMLQIGDMTEGLAEHVVRSMLFEARILESKGDIAKGNLRQKQAEAIADAYGCGVPIGASTTEELIMPFLQEDVEL